MQQSGVSTTVSAGSRCVRFFFFQAEDGIRDKLVTEFRRVLFRSFAAALNDLGNLFNAAANLTRLRKQSASVAALASKANTAFLNGSNTNARIHMSEKKLRN